MPSRARHRAAGAALAAAIVGAVPLAPVGIAWAGPEGGKQVVFRGDGVGLLLCTSEPDQARLNVSAESTVTFVNRTGAQAVLRVDGRDAGTVGPDQAVPVTFRRGPVSVSMVPSCGLNLNQSFGAVTVEVGSAPAGQPATRPVRAPSLGGRIGQETAGIPARQPVDRATAPAQPGSADFPSGGAVLPGGANAPGVSDADNTIPTDNVSISAPIKVVPGPKGANGLLAIVAVVCVAGVGAGAIRAILAQRASRAMLA